MRYITNDEVGDGTRDGGTQAGRWLAGVGWGESHDAPTQQQGIKLGRQALDKLGGGELIFKGRNGRIRMQNTYGRPDPRGRG
jgi:Uncharacterized protein conserved in bacteria (DUF2188)